jgi:hypothetical protein
MFGSVILEVAIGVVFIYLLLGLICSVLNEWIAGIFALRARTLEAGVRNLLNNRQGQGLAEQLYAHPFIKGLARRGQKPSYIPSRIFALALLDTVAPADSATGSRTIQEVRDTITQIADPELKKVLLALIDEAEGDLKWARENIEEWFNEAMNRVSGWYKRQTQWIVLAISLIVTAAVNADTLMIAGSLWNDGAMRASLVAAAQEAAKHPLSTSGQDAARLVDEIQKRVEQHQIPLGWSQTEGDARRAPTDFWRWVAKLIGLLLTAVAVSLGAPFWFDVLNKFIAFRSSGKPPEKTIRGEAGRSEEQPKAARAASSG